MSRFPLLNFSRGQLEPPDWPDVVVDVAARISKGEIKSAAVKIRHWRKDDLRIFMRRKSGSWHTNGAVGYKTLGQYPGARLTLKARCSITAWGNAPGVWSQNASSAESAIQCGRPFVPSMERCKTHQIETRFQRLFGWQSQFLGRYPRLK